MCFVVAAPAKQTMSLHHQPKKKTEKGTLCPKIYVIKKMEKETGDALAPCVNIATTLFRVVHSHNGQANYTSWNHQELFLGI